jgi:hypothetical protein
VALLCIVSRDPLASGAFVATLKTAVGPHDELEIIVDRRRRGPPADQPFTERRHHPHITRALKRDGFAIVPTHAAAQPAEHSDASAAPVERLVDQAADERTLEGVLAFNRRRKVRRTRLLILSGLMGVILSVLVLSLAMTVHRRWVGPTTPPSADRSNESSTAPLIPRVEENSSPNPETPAVGPAPTAAVPPAPKRARVRGSPMSSTPISEPRRAPAASAPNRPANDADDLHAVIDWLLNPSSHDSLEPDQRSMPHAPRR